MSLRSNELHQPLSQVWGWELKNVDPSSCISEDTVRECTDLIVEYLVHSLLHLNW